MYPKESAHFRFFAAKTYSWVLPLNLTWQYRADTIGLRSMMEEGRLELHTLPGEHASVPDDFIRDTLRPYFAQEA